MRQLLEILKDVVLGILWIFGLPLIFVVPWAVIAFVLCLEKLQ